MCIFYVNCCVIFSEPDPTVAPTKTTTTTTQRTTTTMRTTRTTYSPSTTTHQTPKIIESHQYPVHSGPDIRFNPEEINIRLTPGSPPIIKPPKTFQSGYSATTIGSTQKPKSVVSYGLQHTTATNKNYQPSYDYGYQQTENSDLDYNTDVPGYSYHDPNLGHYEQHTLGSKNTNQYVSTAKPEVHFHSSTSYPSSIKPQIYHYQRTDKPNLQIPQSLIPTLPPLTFSSPAPFTLSRHFDQKRSNEHHSPPRVIISASASVSDASGRRLNYSLGTIGTSQLFGTAPSSYDDYRESDVGLDPFYHDVPKVSTTKTKSVRRGKREVEFHDEVFDETTHWIPPDYVDDNYEPLTYEGRIEKNNQTTTETLKVVMPKTEAPKEAVPNTEAPKVTVSKTETPKLIKVTPKTKLTKERFDNAQKLLDQLVEKLVKEALIGIYPRAKSKSVAATKAPINATEATVTSTVAALKVLDSQLVSVTTESSHKEVTTASTTEGTTKHEQLATELITHSTNTEFTTELSTESSTELTTQSINTSSTKSSTQSSTEPTTESTIQSSTELFTESSTESTTSELVAQSSMELTTQSPTESTTYSQDFTTEAPLTTEGYKPRGNLSTEESVENSTEVVTSRKRKLTEATTKNYHLDLTTEFPSRRRKLTTKNPHFNIVEVPRNWRRSRGRTRHKSSEESIDQEEILQVILLLAISRDLLIIFHLQMNTRVLPYTVSRQLPERTTPVPIIISEEPILLINSKEEKKEEVTQKSVEVEPTTQNPSESTELQTESTTIDSMISEEETTQSNDYELKFNSDESLDDFGYTEMDYDQVVISQPSPFTTRATKIDSTTHLPETTEFITEEYTEEVPTTTDSIVEYVTKAKSYDSLTTSLPFVSENVANRTNDLLEINIIGSESQNNFKNSNHIQRDSKLLTSSAPALYTSRNIGEKSFQIEKNDNIQSNKKNDVIVEEIVEELTTEESSTPYDETKNTIEEEGTTRDSLLSFKKNSSEEEEVTTVDPTEEPVIPFTSVYSTPILYTSKVFMENETEREEATTVSSTTSRNEYRTRDSSWRRNRRPKPTTSRHRFSSPSISMSPAVLRLHEHRRLPATTEAIDHIDSSLVTDPDLSKSANPTESKLNVPLTSTTPLTKYQGNHKTTFDPLKSFNCIDKKMNRFYEDPRDCRLFHYCTPGFSPTQVLDMKFVCDYGTYFNIEKLICTKIKPVRCK